MPFVMGHDAQLRGLGGEHPVGLAAAEVRQHVAHTNAAELLVGLAHHDEVPPQRAAAQHLGQRIQQRSHPGLGVAGAAAEEEAAFDHGVEGRDLHGVHGYGVEMRRHQHRVARALAARLGHHAAALALAPPARRRDRAHAAAPAPLRRSAARRSTPLECRCGPSGSPTAGRRTRAADRCSPSPDRPAPARNGSASARSAARHRHVRSPGVCAPTRR